MKEEILKKMLELNTTYDNSGFFKDLKSMMPWENPYQEGFFLHIGTFFYFTSLLLLVLGVICLILKIITNLFSNVDNSTYESLKCNEELLAEKLANMDKSDFHLLNKNEKNSLYNNVKREYKKTKFDTMKTGIIYDLKYSSFSVYALVVGLFIFIVTWGFIYVDYLSGLSDESIELFENYMENPETVKSEILRFEKLSDSEFLIVYNNNSTNIVNEIYSGSFKFRSDIDKPTYEYVDKFKKEDLANTLVYKEFTFDGRESDYAKKFNFGKSDFIVYLPNDFDINNSINKK